MSAARPLIALPARYSASASALRYAALVTAEALAEAVYRAGGEPFMMLPAGPRAPGAAGAEEIAERLARCAGLLLPGGGDLDPAHYGGADRHPEVYDLHPGQDAFDLALAGYALVAGLPTLAVCRGLQVVNTVLGGSLEQDMGGPGRDHRHVLHRLAPVGGSLLASVTGTGEREVSCYHHQRVDRLGRGLRVTARAADGTVEAVELASPAGWFLGVQWHPEDTAAADPGRRAVFEALVEAAAAESRRG
ncbi:gamma-glutamyl-gamma-aminobutyrate hydrolase family protein [Kitasatospora sp. NPDC002965]|uniref:gamma-glutamyl-gamma-aminobutyrate hydrolase family protein n=1 Tax=Kitasatospora sp. NPDC002965 TaxID=3154775 RepID=UPI0033BF112F